MAMDDAALIEQLPQPVWVATPDGALARVNPAWLELAGGPPGPGTPWFAGVHPDDRDAIARAWEHARAAGAGLELTARFGSPPAEPRWMLTRARPIVDGAGHVTGWIGTACDVTEIQRAIRLRDEFLSLASHELKAPLTALLLQVDAIEHRGGPIDPRQWQRLGAQIDRLSRLVDDLLDVSRIHTNQLALAIEEVDLAAVATDVVNDLRDVARARGGELRITMEPIRLACDSSLIGQVLVNLIDNAIKFGDGKPVDVEVFAAGGDARLVVRDRGIGIAADHHARIFERFHRAISTTNVGGLGLGLWIADQIVRRHGGRIEVASAPGQGATFTVSLPLTARV